MKHSNKNTTPEYNIQPVAGTPENPTAASAAEADSPVVQEGGTAGAQAALGETPQHVGIIMDGNGRWATMRGLKRSDGHKAGADAVRRIVTECCKTGIKSLSLYSFSKENWTRPKEEVSFLFGLLVDFLQKELPTLQENNIRLNIFGEMGELPLLTRKALDFTLSRTKSNTGMQLNLVLNYSGREEIARACRKFIEEGGQAQDMTIEAISARLYSAGQPDPDLIIRTSGELRISNFLLFQSAYSEYYFTKTLWPDFSEEELQHALADFAGRKRRFGNI